MIWLKLKQWFWDALVRVVPATWASDQPLYSWRYRFTMRVFVESYAVDYEIYEYRLPLRVTPMPWDDGDIPF